MIECDLAVQSCARRKTVMMLPSRHYESEHTKFMREWMAKHPEQAEEQRKGRALWWDKPQQVARQQELDDLFELDIVARALVDLIRWRILNLTSILFVT